ncbi:MAG: aspartate-alanine antiporter [Desulfobacteraceae bacterium]|nr:aspartate-alanine antiporter [Desulfobacteraceae bacterium]
MFMHQLLVKSPLLVLFITIALGYFVGKFRIKTFVLGGIAGSLIMGVLIGQLDIKMPAAIGTIFFALFIYSVGYQGGPQFFRSINRETGIQLLSSTITCVLGLLCVLIAAWEFGLDRGTAAGLAAGGLTQSAMIGTASDAIAKLGLSVNVTQAMQTNIAVGYAVCYLFGSFGPILILTAIIPAMMKWDLRKEAKKLATTMARGRGVELDPGQFCAIQDIDTRVYQVADDSSVIGQTAAQIFYGPDRVAIVALIRDGQTIDVDADLALQAGDLVAVTTESVNFIKKNPLFEHEIAKPAILQLIEEERNIILSRKEFDGKTIAQCYGQTADKEHYGLFIHAVSRLGEAITPDQDFVLHRGDDIKLFGRPVDLDRVSRKLGHVVSSATITDFIAFSIGIALGVLIGMITVRVFGVSISMGTGGGCLVSGLVFGWLRSRHPRFGNLPTGASNFLRDFGLAVFVAVVGITAGPEAVTTIKQHGMVLLLLGIAVTIIPQIITFFISYYLLKIKNPIEILATIAGGRSANPGFAALLEKAGNSTPVVSFTATYAIANIWLTLWGPVIVALVTKNVS